MAASYNAVLSNSLYNELRFGDTRRHVDRHAARLDGRILPTYAIAGYQQLGSPANTETDFATGVRRSTNTLSWAHDRHTIKAGLDFRWSRLDVVQPPSPAGLYQFSTLFTDLPGVANTGGRSRAFCSARSRASRSTCSRSRFAIAPACRSTSFRTTGAPPID